MRAYDLALMLALFGAVMGLLDSSAVWDGGNIDTGAALINQSTFDELNTIEKPTSVGVIGETIAFSWAAVKLLFQVLVRIVFIADIIAGVFGNSTEAIQVAATIQMGIWLTYAIALFQAKTGKSLKGME